MWEQGGADVIEWYAVAILTFIACCVIWITMRPCGCEDIR